MNVRRTADSPWITAALAAIACCTFVALLLARHDGDVSRLVLAGGGGIVDPARIPPGLNVVPNIGGYDGMMFYRLALDPFTREQDAYGIRLDTPAYRHQRIGYPLLVRILSFGRHELVPSLLLAVNLLAFTLLGAAGGALARHAGLHALWGLAIPFYPGFLIVLSRDTSELLACAFAALAICALQKERLVATAALFCAAVLTRETTLLIPAVLAAGELRGALRDHAHRLRLLAFAAPGVAYVAMQTFVTMRWGMSSVEAAGARLLPPFVEYFRFAANVIPPEFHLERVYLYECLWIAIALVTVALALRKVERVWAFAWLAYVALTFSLPVSVWESDIAFLRALAEFHLVGAVVVLRARAHRIFTIATLLLWPYLAKHVIDYF
jgi:hypothetical protein